MSSAVQALREAGGARVAVATPYIDELSERVAEELTRGGLDVVALHGMGIVANRDIGRVAPEEIVAFARSSLATVDADCVFVSCTNFRVMDCLADLRETVGVPVITSNQAALSAALRTLARGDVKAVGERGQ
jgi:maleate isomerase